MPRRRLVNQDGPPPKKRCEGTVQKCFCVKANEEIIVTDILQRQWRLGKCIGGGSFGEIFLASDDVKREVQNDCEYVAKIEPHDNGPLFVEVNCYLRIAKSAMIEDWKLKKNLSSFGMPHYVASGSHIHKGKRFRFLILPKFERDVDMMLQEKTQFNIKTIVTIALQMLDVLEYIHSKGFIQADIKASNILLSKQKVVKDKITGAVQNEHFLRKRDTRLAGSHCAMVLRPRRKRAYNENTAEFVDQQPNAKEPEHKLIDQIYLLDYGLACKYVTPEGTHKETIEDGRKAHAGTIQFCSRDAHRGIISRRSDLESLGYNMMLWQSGNLPWMDEEDPDIVSKKKDEAMSNLDEFLSNYPEYLVEYFKYLRNLKCQEKPDYDYCRTILSNSLLSYGYKNDSTLDFDNKLVVNPNKTKKVALKKPIKCEVKEAALHLKKSKKHLLRNRKQKNPRGAGTLLYVPDPEAIFKQKKKIAPTGVLNLDIASLNPTYAMLAIYNKIRAKHKVPNEKPPTVCKRSAVAAHKGRSPKLRVNLLNIIPLRRCINKWKRKNDGLMRSLPITRTTKSPQVIKSRDHIKERTSKAGPLCRTFSLRG